MKSNLPPRTNSVIIVALLFAVAAFSLSGCKKEEMPGTNEVWMQNNMFNPSTITVAVNTTITWKNKDGVTHDVTGSSSPFVSGNIADGGTYTHQFTTAGTYPYTCTIHSGMAGTVIVQ